MVIILSTTMSRPMVVSYKAKKKQNTHMSSGLHDHYSELFTRIAAQNFKML